MCPLVVTMVSMDKTSYNNIARGWEFAEASALNVESDKLQTLRDKASEAGFAQCSRSQGAFLQFLAGRNAPASIILVGNGSVVEALRLMTGLHGHGQFTAVDSTAQGTSLVKKIFAGMEKAHPGMRLRAVNAAARTYFPRLNPSDYDLIVVSGNGDNYQQVMDQAPRLLKDRGQLIFTDAFDLLEDPDKGGVLNPANRSAKTTTLRTIMDAISKDNAWESCLLPIGTGMIMATRAR